MNYELTTPLAGHWLGTMTVSERGQKTPEAEMRQGAHPHLHPSLPHGRVFRHAYMPRRAIAFHQSLGAGSYQVDPGDFR